MRPIHLLTSLALAVSAVAAPAAAQEEAPEDAQEEMPEDYDEYYDDEYYGEEEFCGDGEESAFDQAYMSFDNADYADARSILAEALSAGGVHSEMRPSYLVLLGQTQDRLDETRHAAVNFRRAVAAAPEEADDNGARIGLAVVLARRGDRRGALSEANSFIDATCNGEQPRSMQCYLANVVIASATRDGETRDKGRSEARRMFSELRDYEVEAVSYYDELFDVADWRDATGGDAQVGAETGAQVGTVGGAEAQNADAVESADESV